MISETWLVNVGHDIKFSYSLLTWLPCVMLANCAASCKQLPIYIYGSFRNYKFQNVTASETPNLSLPSTSAKCHRRLGIKLLKINDISSTWWLINVISYQNIGYIPYIGLEWYFLSDGWALSRWKWSLFPTKIHPPQWVSCWNVDPKSAEVPDTPPALPDYAWIRTPCRLSSSWSDASAQCTWSRTK